MKVYRFNVDNGVYEGEDFCDDMEVLEAEGITTMPPPEHPPGHILIYEGTVGTWKLVPTADLRRRVNLNV
jgi:hypothetical protein